MSSTFSEEFRTHLKGITKKVTAEWLINHFQQELFKYNCGTHYYKFPACVMDTPNKVELLSILSDNLEECGFIHSKGMSNTRGSYAFAKDEMLSGWQTSTVSCNLNDPDCDKLIINFGK